MPVNFNQRLRLPSKFDLKRAAAAQRRERGEEESADQEPFEDRRCAGKGAVRGTKEESETASS